MLCSGILIPANFRSLLGVFPYLHLDVAHHIFAETMKNPLQNSLEKHRNKLFPLLKSPHVTAIIIFKYIVRQAKLAKKMLILQ